MTRPSGEFCPPDLLGQAIEIARADGADGAQAVAALITRYPRDPNLHFLLGSLLAGLQRYPEARQAMAKALDINPNYALARFQLGLLELTCADVAASEATLSPLNELASDDPLRLFAGGLRRLAHDQLTDAARLLKQGIALNTDNPPLNADMQLIVDAIEQGGPKAGGGDPISATHLLLQQYSNRPTQH